MRRIAVPGLVALLAVGLVALLIFGVLQTRAGSSLDQKVADGGRPVAPDTTLALLDGSGSRSIGEYRGKVVVVNFFASWCPPCAEEAPVLDRAHQALERSGGTVIGIAVDDAREQTQKFVDRFGLDFPVLRDVDRALSNQYGVKGLPETFVIDRDGRIVAMQRNQITQRWVDEHLTPLLSDAQ